MKEKREKIRKPVRMSVNTDLVLILLPLSTCRTHFSSYPFKKMSTFAVMLWGERGNNSNNNTIIMIIIITSLLIV